MTVGLRPWLAVALAGLGGCANRDVVATYVGEDRATYCQAQGPPVLLDGTCTGTLTAKAFDHAVCGCGSLSLAATLQTDGFDSRTGPWTPGGAGADLGASGSLDFASELDVAGNLTVAGSLAAGTRLQVSGDLAVAGTLGRPASVLAVDGGARIGGDVDVAALTVGGALTSPAGTVALGAISASSRVTAPVTVPAPCRCAPDQLLDVAAVVAAHGADNHDAAIGLSPDALADVRADVTLELPCGRFYLSRIQASGGAAVTLRATGRTALFIGGNVTLDGLLTVEVQPGAELDLFVTGNLNLRGDARLGDATRPGALRLYLASLGAVNLASGVLAGNLWAPGSDLTPPADAFGAVVVSHLLVPSTVAVHRDRSVDVAGAACQP
jgi:hypothetical protein